jgi:hypothetical protein
VSVRHGTAARSPNASPKNLPLKNAGSNLLADCCYVRWLSLLADLDADAGPRKSVNLAALSRAETHKGIAPSSGQSDASRNVHNA